VDIGVAVGITTDCASRVVTFEIAFEGSGAGGILIGGIGVGVAVFSILLDSSASVWFAGKRIVVGDGAGVKVGREVEVGESSGPLATAAEVGWGDSQKSLRRTT
jgi:hypothetical protein